LSKRIYRELRELILLVLVAFIISLGIRAAIAETYVIPTGSMIPTIEIGDRVLVNKLAYRFRLPERGEIVIFDPPEGIGKLPFLKRVIGLPGDTVEVRDGNVYVNGSVLKVEEAEDTNYEYGPEEVPKGYIFVLGDNRNNSFDSHCWGFVPLKNLIGEGVLVFWPPADAKLLNE